MNKIQYTIRNIPPAVDKVIRKQAKRTNQSLNTTVIGILTAYTLGDRKAHQDAFNNLQGANSLDEHFDQAIKEQSKVDSELWS